MFTTQIFYTLLATLLLGLTWRMLRKINVTNKDNIPLPSLLELSARRLVLLIAILSLIAFISSSVVRHTLVEASDAENYVKQEKCDEKWSGMERNNIEGMIASCKEDNERKQAWFNSQQFQAMKSSPLYGGTFFMFITVEDIKESAMLHADFVEMMLKSAGKEEDAFKMKQTLSEATDSLVHVVKLSDSSWPVILTAFIVYCLSLGGIFLISIYKAVKSKNESHSTDVASVFSGMFVRHFWSVCFVIMTINIYI